MNRAEEIATIESHVAAHGVTRCAPWESHYGDNDLSMRQRIYNSMKAGKMRKARRRVAKPSKPTKPCKHCGEPLSGDLPTAQEFCNRACYRASRKAVWLDLKCGCCGTEFQRQRCCTRDPERAFCSHKCSGARRRRAA